MTPAITQLKKAGVVFELLEYGHNPDAPSYGLEAAEALAVPPHSVFKTLLAKLDGKRLVVAMVPVSGTLNLKALAKAAGAKKAEMADAGEAERSSGYVVGGISPFGHKRRLLTVLDSSAMQLPIIHVSGGRRGLEISIAPGDLASVLGAVAASIAA